MNLERLTDKSREALSLARQLGLKHNHQELQQEHLALALLSDPQGLIAQLLTKDGEALDLTTL